jgi:hypothetical protein
MGRHHKKVNFGHIIKEIGHDLGNGSKEVFHTGKNLIEAPMKLADKGLEKVSGITQEFGLPLIIVGGVVLIYFIKNK